MPRIASKSKKLPSEFEDLVRLHPPRPIHDESDYDNMQEVIDRLTCIARPSKGQQEYLETLSILFAAYEAEHHAIDIDGLTPLQVLQHLMEQHGLAASDLGRILGERTLGSKILRGQRQLSKAHIRALADYFSVSPELFL
jgi:HTH-type transcriptional regulator/antitoxin HigA